MTVLSAHLLLRLRWGFRPYLGEQTAPPHASHQSPAPLAIDRVHLHPVSSSSRPWALQNPYVIASPYCPAGVSQEVVMLHRTGLVRHSGRHWCQRLRPGGLRCLHTKGSANTLIHDVIVHHGTSCQHNRNAATHKSPNINAISRMLPQ